jgi:hypothetical protein
MNAYDQKHLALLELIDAGNWQAIAEDDLGEVNVLVVCKYVATRSVQSGEPGITICPEGREYLQRLTQMALADQQPG